MPARVYHENGPTCAACRHFSPADHTTDEGAGECRKNPPVIVQVGVDLFRSAFPDVAETDWCGEFEFEAPPQFKPFKVADILTEPNNAG